MRTKGSSGCYLDLVLEGPRNAKVLKDVGISGHNSDMIRAVIPQSEIPEVLEPVASWSGAGATKATQAEPYEGRNCPRTHGVGVLTSIDWAEAGEEWPHTPTSDCERLRATASGLSVLRTKYIVESLQRHQEQRSRGRVGARTRDARKGGELRILSPRHPSTHHTSAVYSRAGMASAHWPGCASATRGPYRVPGPLAEPARWAAVPPGHSPNRAHASPKASMSSVLELGFQPDPHSLSVITALVRATCLSPQQQGAPPTIKNS